VFSPNPFFTIEMGMEKGTKCKIAIELELESNYDPAVVAKKIVDVLYRRANYLAIRIEVDNKAYVVDAVKTPWFSATFR
jgi:hypothetical protein